jgi:RNA-directed DNA polymerase
MQQASRRRHEFYLGLIMEQRKSHKNDKGKAQVRERLMRPNTDVLCDGGLNRSSEEVSVMEMERRVEVVQLELEFTTLKIQRTTNPAQAKGIPITKQMVYDAYKKVYSNKGKAGIDNQTLQDFEAHKSKLLYKLWNRLTSGSYFPMEVREVSIPKTDGKQRKLGIPTVTDRIAQEVIRTYLEPRMEAEFSNHSYGYRPLRSAHQAVAKVKENVLKHPWVIDMDIKGFFDNMSHEKLVKALEVHVKEKWAIMYIKRWLTAPMVNKQGKVTNRTVGTPQGGVISPLLANLFLHYAFDKWMMLNYPNINFVRYADDIIVHCNTEKECQTMLIAINNRINNCDLTLHPNKTKIVYCKTANRKIAFKTVKFDFLGFSFQPRPVQNKKTQEMFLSFGSAISKEKELQIAEIIRRAKLHQRTNSTLENIATEFNPKLKGWFNYYGKFSLYKLNRIFGLFNWRLIKWAVNKYKSFKGSMRKAANYIRETAKNFPNLFVHWQYDFGNA